LSNDAAMILIDKIETLVKEKKVLKDKMIKIELESLDNIDGKEEFIYENILEFNTNLSVDQKRNITINIFKEIVYDYKTDKFEVFFN
ncbi:MAG: resolvase, partial [Clostridium perfringens]